jgi:hypothetical protein
MRRRFCVAGCKRGGRKEGWMDGKKKEEEGGREKDGMEGDGMDFIDSIPSCSGWRGKRFLLGRRQVLYRRIT